MSSKSGYRTKIPSETKGIEGVREEKESDKRGKKREPRAAEVAQWVQCLLHIVGPEFRSLEPMEKAKRDSGWGLLLGHIQWERLSKQQGG